MATVVEQTIETFADLLKRIGDVPLERIRFHPPPGTATEEDVIRAASLPRKRLCELVEGVLVEKPVGAKESSLTLFLGHVLHEYLEDHDLGELLGESGAIRLMKGLVRMPDISFISYGRLPGGELSDDPIVDAAPELAIEILSKSNTRKEMKRKTLDYFTHGVTLVWLIDPKKQTAEVYHSPADVKKIGKSGALDGEVVLPGFTLPLKVLFSRRRKGRQLGQ